MKRYSVISLDLSKARELPKNLDFVKELRSKLEGGQKVDLPGVTHLAVAEQEHYKHLRLILQTVATASISQHSSDRANGAAGELGLSFKKDEPAAAKSGGHEVVVLWFFLDRLDELESHAEAFASDVLKLCETTHSFTPIPGGIYVGCVDSHSPTLSMLKEGELRSSKKEIDIDKAKARRPSSLPPAEPAAESQSDGEHAAETASTS